MLMTIVVMKRIACLLCTALLDTPARLPPPTAIYDTDHKPHPSHRLDPGAPPPPPALIIVHVSRKKKS